MGMLTDFLVATPEELASSFPAWLEVADEPIVREVINPFTQQKQLVRDWPPKQTPTENVSDQDRLPNYRHLPHAEFKSIDDVKLAMLHQLIGGIAYETCIEQFDRPAMLNPWQSNETGLFQLSSEFVTSLAALGDTDMADAALAWAATEEMQLDDVDAKHCEVVLRELVRLARNARDSHRGMYFSWSL